LTGPAPTGMTRGNPGVAVHQRPQAQPSLELLDRQRPQQRRLQREILPDGASPAGDPPGVVELKVDRDLAFHGPSARITWLVAMRPGEVGGHSHRQPWPPGTKERILGKSGDRNSPLHLSKRS
jgi:hypothetical protein